MQIHSDAGGRLRLTEPALHGNVAVALAVEEHVGDIAGVRAVHAHPRTASIVIWYRESTPRTDLLAAIESAVRHPATNLAGRSLRSADVSNAEVARLAAGGAFLLLLGVRRYGLRRPPRLGPSTRTAATAVTIFSGYPFLKGSVRALRGGRAGTDALVSAATIASLLLRENVVALTVLWLLNVGEFLQELTLRRTRRAIADLLNGRQDKAWVLQDDGSELEIPIETLRIGDLVVVHERIAIPVDGTVHDGEAAVDQSALTGENLPVTCTAGTSVFAGSVVMTGRIVVRATAVGNETAIGRILHRVTEAHEDRAPIQTIGDSFSRRFVPMSFLLSAASLVATRDLRRAMTMLLIACPCAVGLSTPTAIGAAVGNGAKRGILIKGGSHLEAAGRVTAFVFDKTGTLTVGRPVVTNVVSFHGDWTPEQVLAHAASSEIHSRHPLAEAVIRSTEERRIEIPSHVECEVVVGLGMRTLADDGRTVLLGSPAFLTAEGVVVSQEARGWVTRLQQQCETPLLLAVDRDLIGLLSLRDTVRPEAREVLDALRAQGVSHITMLTGDHPGTAAAIAAELGIDDWLAEAMPEDKLAVVSRLQAEGHVVAVVGDGVNDAPSLAASDIGVAMGLSGTDVAVETADVALAGDDLRKLLALRDLGDHTVAVIRQNYGLSIAVNAVGLAIGAGGALSPVVAAVLHNASSVAVVMNSTRLVRYQLG